MNQLLFDRSTGNISPSAFQTIQTSGLLKAIQHAPRQRFDGGEREAAPIEPSDDTGATPAIVRSENSWAHQAGVNALSIDIDGRILLSGGADGSTKLWDLEEYSDGAVHTFKPTATIPKSASSHSYGITNLTFYPFDSAAFLSSSYDHHLKLYATESLSLSADFDLSSVIYNHALSPIASHLLVACATQHPTVRLVDLRSGSSTHSLAGHHGAVVSVSWNPNVEHILASGGIDGTVRLWDIRKSSGALGVLNMDDSTGIAGFDGLGRGARARDSGKAHQAPVNGLTWTDNGSYIVSAGHDERVRVWNASSGANTLASFGPTLKNGHLSNLPLLVSSTYLVPPRKEVLFYPNEKEILMFELHEGKLLKRLKVPGPTTAAVRSRTGERNIKSRITSLVCRGQFEGVYSAHTDGQIRAWLPRTKEDDMEDKEEEAVSKGQGEDDSEIGKRKRKVLDDVFRDLTRQKITFG